MQSLKRCTFIWPSWLRPSVASGTSLPTIARHICALVAMSSVALEGFVLCAAWRRRQRDQAKYQPQWFS